MTTMNGATLDAGPSHLEIYDALNDARHLIINYGWRQHAVGDTMSGFSADGAILATTGHDRALLLGTMLAFKRAIGQYEPGPWNDVYGRTLHEVDGAFRRAMRLTRNGDES